MSGLKIFLLGPPRVELDGTPIDIKRRKALAMLIYLVVTGQPHSRDALATLFYPDHSQSRARAYLRRDLAVLNTSLAGNWLDTDRDTVEIQNSDQLWLDVERFRHHIATYQSHDHPSQTPCADCLPLLTEAVKLYTDDFLAGFTLRDCPEFDDWQFFQAESLRQELATTLESLVQGCSQQGNPEAAIPYARRWVALDPLHEPAQQALIQLYDQAGHQAAALRQYEEYVDLLEEELGLPPEEETATLYEAIKAKRMLRPFLKAGLPSIQPSSQPQQKSANPSLSPTDSPSLSPAAPLLFAGDEPKEMEPIHFVAREQELDRLNTWLETALAGQFQVAFITGEAGLGKSALLQAFVRRAQAAHPELVAIGGNCNAYTGIGDPYLPFREIMELLTGDVEARAAAGTLRQEQAWRLWQLLPQTVQALIDAGPELLDTFIPAKALLNRAAAQAQGDTPWLTELRALVDRPRGGAQQSSLFKQYTGVLQRLFQETPLLLFLDDLQWADSGSTHLLFHLARQLTGCRVLIIGAYRPAEVALGRGDERHPLEKVVNELQRDFGDIILDLSQAEGRAFIDAWLDSQSNQLDDSFRQMLYQQTGGQPLFTIELLHDLQARGELVQNETGEWVAPSQLNWQSMPARVEGAIGERISRLPAHLQELLQVASTEGEEFTAEVIAQVLNIPSRTVVRQLSSELDKTHRLVQPLGIKQVGARRVSRYRFRHILIQRYLYNSLDEIEKSHLNETVGSVLEVLYAEQTEQVAVQLARYYQEAGHIEKAIAYLLQAGMRARLLSANEEAISHLAQALTLLETLPNTSERAQQELDVLITLGPALMLIRGHSAPEVEQSYTRAYELCQQVQEPAKLFPALWGLWRFNQNRANLQIARQMADRCLALAQAHHNVEFLVEAHIALGTTLLFLGKFTGANEHFEQVKALYDPYQHRFLPFLYGDFDPTVYRLCYQAYLLWLQGYPDQSQQRSDEALNLARELAHPYSLVYASGHTAIHFQFRQDGLTVQKLAAEATLLSREQGFSTFLGLATILDGWALVQQGQADGLIQLRQGLTDYFNILFVPYFQALLADACLQLGQIDEGLAALAKAIDLLENTDERFWEAELYRLKGELLLKKQTVLEQAKETLSPEDCFLKAIDIARHQQAKSLELRAAVNLGRLWQEQGRKDDARRMLEDIYNWFTEGFETADLQEARALLEKLGGEVKPGRRDAETHPLPPASPPGQKLEQEIRFCLTSDGVRIAYATVGQGPVFVKTANWLSHLEYDWQSPVWRHWLASLSQSHTLVRYDRRGCGLSDWEVDDFSLEAYVMELETVVNTLGLTRFPLLALSGGGPVAITYAARHPEKVSHLILYGSYARGRMYRSHSPEQAEEGQLLLKMMELGWGKSNPAFRQAYTSLFIPEGTAEQINWFNDLQRISTSPEIATRMSEATYAVDVSHVAPKVIVPTLILHAHDDAVVPFEESRHLAALIPGARFVPLESKNHILLEDEPAWQQFLIEVEKFIQTEFEPPIVPIADKPESLPFQPPADQLSETPSSTRRLMPAHNLPVQSTEFLGRKKELTEIQRLLGDKSNCRLLTLVGPGGIGKTRLALEAATQATPGFADGVYFVPLAPLTSVDEIVSTLAEVLDFRFYEGDSPKTQLLDFLQDKQMMLLLDNFEHVLAGVELLAEILQNAPRIKIMSTSRERLNLSGEMIFTVGGMEIPPSKSLTDTLEFDAAKLFLQQARLAQPNFVPQAEDRAGIKHVCRLTQGMPLALVLAAGWLNILSVKEIAAELNQSLDILETDMGDVPERQRSVRAVFDSSWRYMSQVEQQMFMKLSVFRGGFTRQAAQTVTGAGLPTLRALINKSLIISNQNERYEIHELLRQYGEMELDKGDRPDDTRQDHSAYYLDLLHQREADIIGPKQRETLNQIEADLDNIRTAWHWAIENDQVEAIEHSLESLYHFYWIRSHFQEGEKIFGIASARLQTLVEKSQPHAENVLLRLLSRQGAFCYALGLVKKATEQLQKGLELARRLDNKKELAFVLNYLGEIARTQGKFLAAIQLFEESLSASREIDEPLYIAQALKGLGWASTEEGGAYVEAKGYYEEALTYYRAAGHQAEIAYCLDKLGFNAWELGDYLSSQNLFQESLDINRNIGDQLGTAKALGGLALVGRSLGGEDLIKAEPLARESLEICRATGHKLEIANRLNILGMVLFNLGKLDQAEQYLQEATDLSGKIHYDVGVTIASNFLGQVANNRQEFHKAQEFFIEALGRAYNNQRSQDIADVLISYAVLLVDEAATQDNDEAENEKIMNAVELLTLATKQPSAWQDIKDKGSRLLVELEGKLPPESFLAARTRANNLTLDQATTEILQIKTDFSVSVDAPPEPFVHRFVEETLITTGGMGEVYRGRDTQTGLPVAIKRLRPDLLAHNPEVVQRFLLEGETLSQLDHPNIVKMLALVETGNQPMIIMEYVSGGTLSDLLIQQPQLPLEQVLSIGLELADALARVHHLGIIHRDIKPGNVLLAEDGTPRLTDFGVAYLARPDTRLTKEGQILGTTVYMSPEAWRGEPLDARSDIWSFGAVLYEMLTGRPPFEAENPVAIMTAILNDPLPDLLQLRPDTPPVLVELINKILVKDRNQRIDSMRQVAARLEIVRNAQL